jgi:hypothetical protein
VARIHVTDTPNATVMGNMTVVEPEGTGWTTGYPCAEGRPNASNNNYVFGQTTPNFAVLKADAAGDICIYTSANSHLIWDQVGATTAFATGNAVRKLDTRSSGKIGAGGFARVHVSDTGGVTVLGNITVTEPEGGGWTTAYPCADGRPNASNNNYVFGQTTPNFAVLKADAAGDICIYTSATAHLLFDQVGATGAFAATNAARKLDTRTSGKVGAGGFAKVHVSDTGGVTVLGNITVTQPDAGGWTTAYPCAEGRPNASNNNYVAGETTPNFAILKADAAGDICIYTSAPAHVIFDQVGATGAFGAGNAVRKLDTRG